MYIHRGYNGIMEKKTESTTMGYIGIIRYIYRGSIGMMEKKMEITVL